MASHSMVVSRCLQMCCSAMNVRNILGANCQSAAAHYTRLEMRLVAVFILSLPMVYAQTCVPSRILPTGNVSGSLDSASCQLSDGTDYSSYRLDLPTRGNLLMDLTSAADLVLILRSSTGAKLDSDASIHRAIEAGSYSVLVNGRTPGQAGAYSLKSKFSAEPGMMCTNFPNAGLNQTTAGTLGAAGCLMPDGTPYDGYWLTTFGSGSITVSVSSQDFATSLFLRDQDGHLLASNDSRISAPVEGDSRFQIVVATSGQTGEYQLTTSFQPADDETCRAQKTLSDSGSDTAAISATSCIATTTQSADYSYFNYYNLTVSTAGLVDLSVSSEDFIPTLYLLDEGGNLLAVDSGGGATTGQSQIRLQLMPGNYSVQVFSSIPAGGAYTLTYQLTPGAPQPCMPVPANPGETVAGVLSALSCRSSLGLSNLYAVTLPEAGTLDVDLNATSFSGRLAIRDSKDNLLILDEDVQGLGVSHVSADLPAGSYNIAAAANFGAGSYQVMSKFTAHEIPACTYVQDLNINGGYIQKLGPRSCRGADGQPVDLYQFTLPSDSVVAAIMTSSEIDGFLSITDASGNTLRSDDNSYGQGDPLIVQFLPAGTYQVAARAASNTVGGYYEVDLRTIDGGRPPFCGSKGKLDIGAAIAGNVNFAGCQYVDATFADIYQIDLASDTTIDLRLNSGDFDAYLVLLDAKGNVVDQDDDGGGDTNARINRPLDKGTYFVVAKPLGSYTAGGAYTLTRGAAF